MEQRDPASFRVVRIIARLNVGGPALHTMHLTAGLSERYPTLLVSGTVAAGEADLTPRARTIGLATYSLPKLGRELRFFADLSVAFGLYRLLRRERPLIVHTHTAKAGVLGRLAAVAARVPIRVHTFHGHVFHGYFPPWKTRVFLGIERALARVTSRIVAISPAQARDLSERFRVCASDRIAVIPLGLDLERFDPARTASFRNDLRTELGLGDEPIVSIVGRLEPIKNHSLLLRAARTLADRGGRAHFVIVGGGTLDADLRAQAVQLGIANRVHFLGWRDDLDRIYAGSDVVALTSVNEGTPVCLIEALSAGRPVVSRNVGGVRDVLDHGKRGTLVDDDTPLSFALALESVLGDGGRAERDAIAGARYIMEAYGVGRLVSDIERLYDELLGELSPPPPGTATHTTPRIASR